VIVTVVGRIGVVGVSLGVLFSAPPRASDGAVIQARVRGAVVKALRDQRLGPRAGRHGRVVKAVVGSDG
jgi:hypothetical protein